MAAGDRKIRCDVAGNGAISFQGGSVHVNFEQGVELKDGSVEYSATRASESFADFKARLTAGEQTALDSILAKAVDVGAAVPKFSGAIKA